MFACQWHIDIPFGKQKEVVDIMQRWNDELEKTPGAPKYLGKRILVGHIGSSPSHVISEYLVDSLADWEAMQKLVGTGKYQQHSDAVAKYIAPGSQRWEVLRVAG